MSIYKTRDLAKIEVLEAMRQFRRSHDDAFADWPNAWKEDLAEKIADRLVLAGGFARQGNDAATYRKAER